MKHFVYLIVSYHNNKFIEMFLTLDEYSKIRENPSKYYIELIIN